MSDTDGMGFGKFVPGFDFLQNLAKGTSQSMTQMPNLANWVSPSLNVEDLEKRIDELRTVHFWLDQNSRALAATIQALEVQKMTLATLKDMNFNMGEVANAFKLKSADSVANGLQMPTERAGSTAKTFTDDASAVADAASKAAGVTSKPAAGPASLIDPVQLWGSLTQQFQQIAAGAMQEATRKTALDATHNMSAGLAKHADKAGKKAAASGTRKAASKKAASRSRKASP